MCLRIGTVTPKGPKYGWKVFRRLREDGHWVRRGFCIPYTGSLRAGRWLCENDFRLQADYNQGRINLPFEGPSFLGGGYPMGWHVYTKKRDAAKYLYGASYELRKVAIREVVATGYQLDCRVIVCKKIKILPVKP